MKWVGTTAFPTEGFAATSIKVLPQAGRVGRVGIGTWPMGGTLTVGDRSIGCGNSTTAEAIALLGKAISSGMNFIDTADIYGDGRAERIIGEINRVHKLSPVICTKFGNRIDGARVVQDFSVQWLQKSVDASLRRLRTDKIDILLFHSPPDDFDWSDYDRHALDRLIAAGKIGCYGASCRTLRGAEKFLSAKFGSAIEIIYNVIDRRAEAKVLPLAAELGVTVIARCPLAYGLLVASQERKFPPGDHRSEIDSTTRRWIEAARNSLSFLVHLPGGFAASAIRFCLTDRRIDIVIPGLQRMAHLDAALAAAELGPLPGAIIQKIVDAVPDTYPGWDH